eukprot:NODE_1894_length_1764_cov_33.818403_g1611_i0.p2 GENE.NODE_1894_length_1764_cov_33.818403_g1611_i0~~NODE_1894_length_1764_cov_33.818403_g1611_i0.p2  ORF type:complete len:259 (-),score=59.17 NODE_1894_length_1764_cov_33.818403_g1611_i0:116-892(-)
MIIEFGSSSSRRSVGLALYIVNLCILVLFLLLPLRNLVHSRRTERHEVYEKKGASVTSQETEKDALGNQTQNINQVDTKVQKAMPQKILEDQEVNIDTILNKRQADNKNLEIMDDELDKQHHTDSLEFTGFPIAVLSPQWATTLWPNEPVSMSYQPIPRKPEPIYPRETMRPHWPLYLAPPPQDPPSQITNSSVDNHQSPIQAIAFIPEPAENRRTRQPPNLVLLPATATLPGMPNVEVYPQTMVLGLSQPLNDDEDN